ncbi:DUF1493 family protein, partial [Salmonella enterica subsp. enterica serovar Kentucky]|nr:DUF1493 family protein [Salmonella enterica subsp. enterica serovar Kentucky]
MCKSCWRKKRALRRIYELVRSHDGIYLFKKKELTPSTDLDSDLRLEDDEALALMD